MSPARSQILLFTPGVGYNWTQGRRRSDEGSSCHCKSNDSHPSSRFSSSKSQVVQNQLRSPIGCGPFLCSTWPAPFSGLGCLLGFGAIGSRYMVESLWKKITTKIRSPSFGRYFGGVKTSSPSFLRFMIRTATLLDRDIRQSVQISGKIRARKRPGRK